MSILSKEQQRKVIDHAWQYGHFRNPDFPSTHNVLDTDIPNLTAKDEVVRQAVLSVERSDANLFPLAYAHHGRHLDENGEMGPAVLSLTDFPRCGVPEFGNEFDQENATGSGGWIDCDPKHDFPHEVRIMVDMRNAARHWAEAWNEIEAAAVKISASIGLHVRHIDYDDRDEGFESSVRFENIRGGVIGYYYLPRGNSCQQIPQGALDNSYTADLQSKSLLWIHEGLGHGIKLPHTRGGIMNPSLLRVPISWKNDPSFPRLKQMYGGEPIDVGGPPPPDEGEVLFEYEAKAIGEKIKLISGNPGNGGWRI